MRLRDDLGKALGSGGGLPALGDPEVHFCDLAGGRGYVRTVRHLQDSEPLNFRSSEKTYVQRLTRTTSVPCQYVTAKI